MLKDTELLSLIEFGTANLTMKINLRVLMRELLLPQEIFCSKKSTN